MIHVRFEGRSYEVDLQDRNRAGKAADQDLLNRLATYFDADPNRFDGYVVDRRPNGEVIVRPEAVYG